jgi:hypothetical protein
MTVKELIEILKVLDQNRDIRIANDFDDEEYAIKEEIHGIEDGSNKYYLLMTD